MKKIETPQATEESRKEWEMAVVFSANRTVIAIDDIPKERWKYVKEGLHEILDSYRQALEKEIETRKDELVSMATESSGGIHVATYEAKFQECEHFLTLLNNVKPPTK